jgi:hypothetical protein
MTTKRLPRGDFVCGLLVGLAESHGRLIVLNHARPHGEPPYWSRLSAYLAY